MHHIIGDKDTVADHDKESNLQTIAFLLVIFILGIFLVVAICLRGCKMDSGDMYHRELYFVTTEVADKHKVTMFDFSEYMLNLRNEVKADLKRQGFDPAVFVEMLSETDYNGNGGLAFDGLALFGFIFEWDLNFVPEDVSHHETIVMNTLNWLEKTDYFHNMSVYSSEISPFMHKYLAGGLTDDGF